MPRDVNQVLDEIGMGSYQVVQCLLFGGVLIADGAEILLSSSLLTALKTLWKLTPLMRGTMMSMIFVGVFLGGLIGGRVSDVYGRRTGILLSYAGIIIFGTATAAAQGPISMIALRFFFGASFGCGMGPGTAMQVETAPSSWRAHIVNLAGLWFSTGEIYTSILLIIFMPDLTDPDGTRWRWVTVFSMVPGIILFPFAFFLLQETPYFLSSNGRRAETVRSLEYIGTMNKQQAVIEGLDGDDPNLRLECEVPDAGSAAQSSDGGQASSLLEGEGEGEGSSSSSADADAAQGSQNSFRETFGVLLSAQYRSILIGGCYLCFLANFLFYGLTYALPQIFSKIGHDLKPAVQVLIISICDMPGVLLAFFLIYSKTIGHRDGLAILATAASVFTLCLISIDHGDAGLYIGLPSSYISKYVASAFFTLCYVYLAEVFPSKVRGTGLSCCISAGRLGSMLSPLIVEALHIKGFVLGEHAPFLLTTSVLCMIGVVVVKLTLTFELKNAPLKDAAMTKPHSVRRPSELPIDPDKPRPAA